MQDSGVAGIYKVMNFKLSFLSGLLCLCSCTEPKYTDEPFFRLEYTMGGDRITDEDYGIEERGLFGIYYSTRISGGFQFKPVNDTVRLAGFTVDLNVYDYFNDVFNFDIVSPEAFFICGKKYSFQSEPGILSTTPVRFYHKGKEYYFLRGDFCFSRLWESSKVDRYLMNFNFDCFPATGNPADKVDTLKIRDGYLTVCRRYMETPGTLQKMILYER